MDRARTNDRSAWPARLRALAAALDAGGSSRDALSAGLSLDDVAPWLAFDEDAFAGREIARGASWSLTVRGFRPGQSTSMGHAGASSIATLVLRGSAREVRLGARDRVHAPGDVIEIARGSRASQIENAGDDALVTLHVEAPALALAPRPRERRDVVVVGGGFSGAAVAFHLLRRGDRALRITLVERGPWLGRGVAYGVDSPVFRLNVPASKMSIDPESPGDFASWAGAPGSAFLERARFARYVVERLDDAIRDGAPDLRVVRGEASSIDHSSITLANGATLAADVVVVATGIEPRLSPSPLVRDARIVDAWDEAALAALPKDGRVLILGAGLSALDVTALLRAHDFRGTVTILSRRGLLPRPHLEPSRSATPMSRSETAQAPRTLRGLLAWARVKVRDGEANGTPWQLTLDALRPHVTSLYRQLSPVDRARFVRSVRPYWDVLRHRAPVESLSLVEAWKSEGRLEVLAGRIARCEARGDSLHVAIALASGASRSGRFDRIVRCLGPALDRREGEAPLLRELVARGLAAEDPAGLGIVTDERGRVVDGRGVASDRLFAIGALRRASSWETTSVPDIAVHASELARAIVA